jgi:hypothetical protein
MYNPYIEGWINYYGQFYRTRLRSTLKRIDVYVIRWARRKFKRLRRKTKGARDWLSGFAAQIQLCSLTGSYVMATAEHREPYESRGSRTVLGARGGEIPPRDSTKRESAASAGRMSASAGCDPRIPALHLALRQDRARLFTPVPYRCNAGAR